MLSGQERQGALCLLLGSTELRVGGMGRKQAILGDISGDLLRAFARVSATRVVAIRLGSLLLISRPPLL